MLKQFHQKIIDEFSSIKKNQFKNIDQVFENIIESECKEINLIKKDSFISKKYIELKEYLKNEKNDVECLQHIIKILFNLYTLKYKLHLILGEYNIDYKIYINTSIRENNWYSFCFDNKYTFKDSYQILFQINNINHFHFQHIIYDNLKRIIFPLEKSVFLSEKLSNNDLFIPFIYNMKEDYDLYNIMSLILKECNNNIYLKGKKDKNTSDINLYDFILLKTSFGKIMQYTSDHFYNQEKNEIILNKHRSLKDIGEIILSLRNNYDKVKNNIEYSDNIIPLIELNTDINQGEISSLEEYILKNVLEHHYNKIEFLNNIPNEIKISDFNLKNKSQMYSLYDCIDIYLTSIELISKLKNKFISKEYILNENENKDKIYRDIINKQKIYNDELYDSLLCIYSKLYLMIYYIDLNEFVNSNIYNYLYNDLNNNYHLHKINQLSFINKFVKYISTYIKDNYLANSKNILSYDNNTIYKKYYNYKPCYTLRQINSLYDSNKKDLLFDILIKVLFGYIKDKDILEYTKNEINSIINNNIYDHQIYFKFNLLIKNKDQQIYDRSLSRIKDLNEFFNSKYIKNKEIKSTEYRYLDFGGGDGQLCSSISKLLNLKKENSICMDIASWYGHERDNTYDNIRFEFINSNLINGIKNGELNLITCFMVLHHIKHYDSILDEFFRILKKDGILIIREHDCEDYLDNMLIDVEHSLFETTIERKTDIENLKFLNSYEANYFTKKELNEIIIKKGFKDITSDINKNLYNIRGPTRYYYSIFIKI